MGWKKPPQDYRGGVYDRDELPQDIFPAKLTAVVGGLYSFTEQTATGPNYGGWQDLPGGRSGTDTVNPAYEPNDVAIDVSLEPVVFLMIDYLDATLDWVYVIVGSAGTSSTPGTITVKDSDGSSICPNIDTIIIDVDSMDADCTGVGEVTLSALIDQDIYVLYQDDTLKSVPCENGSISTPPYSNGIIAQWQTKPGLNFQNNTNTLYTNPTVMGGNGTITNCTPSMPPADGFYCHKNPGGNNCSNDPYFETNDTAVIGPYGNMSLCNSACSGGNSPYHFYSETPGINWLVTQGNSSGDTGPCTAVLKASVTYPPPNQSQLVNGYIPGQGTLYPLNLTDSCTITWLVRTDAVCGTINISPNWNGLSVYGLTSCPWPDCSADPDLLGHANALVFDPCSFKVVDVGASCDDLWRVDYDIISEA